MKALHDLIPEIALFMKAHLPSIAIGIVSTVLVIYGSAINRFVLRLTRSVPFVGRFIFFVFLCSFGYGLVSSQIVKVLRNFLAALPDLQLILGVCGAFVVLGFLARNSREV